MQEKANARQPIDKAFETGSPAHGRISNGADVNSFAARAPNHTPNALCAWARLLLAEMVSAFRQQRQPTRNQLANTVRLCRFRVFGSFIEDDTCTCRVERNNLTIRTMLRRYVRRTIAFAKKNRT